MSKRWNLARQCRVSTWGSTGICCTFPKSNISFGCNNLLNLKKNYIVWICSKTDSSQDMKATPGLISSKKLFVFLSCEKKNWIIIERKKIFVYVFFFYKNNCSKKLFFKYKALDKFPSECVKLNFELLRLPTISRKHPILHTWNLWNLLHNKRDALCAD